MAGYKIQFRNTTTGRMENVNAASELEMSATVRAARSQGEDAVTELRVRTEVPTRFGTEWADVTDLAKRHA